MENRKKIVDIICKIVLTAVVIPLSFFAAVFCGLIFYDEFIGYGLMAVIPAFFIPMIWFKDRKKVLIGWSIFFAVFVISAVIRFGIREYDRSITVNTTPNINVHEYLPFDEESKIVTLDHEASLKLEDDLPTLDGAAAVFPVYSAFVNAVYPDRVKLWDGYFEYNNTVGGYILLGEKKTDIFFGAYPSEEQIAEAKSNGTEFIYTPIGMDAFVFFVHKDNPIDNLTSEQVRAIYSGEITNWKELGGDNEEIIAYQRNEGSGSQSMLIRFMDGKEIMEAPTERVNDLMSGIVERVSDYRSKPSSIGFSYRYYLEGIIKNPDIKILSIDGVAPTVENIKNGTYPISGPLYAVTYEGNENENVEKLIEWIISDEGQEIIEKTGYVGIN
ncbi:MAG: PstS family phosphate ABC transporter substrate-binding protein [Oscillospiraceae bacterium]|nr:PstS family phosphate ABC transporter substrate-binding protein [Oscillospiraceae bacterium]